MSNSTTHVKEMYKQFQNIVFQFARAINEEKTEYTRDAAIKRFELSFELAWKLIKAYIEEFHGIISQSPRSCIREAYKLSILDYDDYWLTIADLRNRTSHIYNLDMAEEIYSQLPETLERFNNLLVYMEQSLNENNSPS